MQLPAQVIAAHTNGAVTQQVPRCVLLIVRPSPDYITLGDPEIELPSVPGTTHHPQ